eukprot:GHRR01015188.1.p1 GENE.GHRR01015188.1~~GHRR01015188.1.p1  ORF type:complete len:168 (+),score=50.95 GHRR01015188.1:610-1113(+)
MLPHATVPSSCTLCFLHLGYSAPLLNSCCACLLQARAQELRGSYREVARKIKGNSSVFSKEMDELCDIFPQQALTDDGQSVELPFTPEALKLALLNAERYAERQVQRQLKTQRVQLPPAWQDEISKHNQSPREPEVDYKALVAAVERMPPDQFEQLDMDQLLAQYSR